MSFSPTDAATVLDVAMPQMGTSIAEGTVIGWRKSVGDAVEVDETLCEIATDKVDSECPSPAAGILVEILVPEGDTVEVGTVLARIAPRAVPAGLPPASGRHANPGALPSVERSLARSGPEPARDRRRYSPVVARIAAEHAVDLSEVAGTGRNGRVTKKDVIAFIESPANEEPLLHSDSPYRPDPPGESVRPAAVTSAPPVKLPADPPAAPAIGDLGGEVVPLSRMRQSIAAAMRRSQETAATAHTVVECDMSRVERQRREAQVTALPIVAREVIDVLRDFSDLNATMGEHAITRYDRVHLGIAVSLGPDGLIVPVIHDAQDLSVGGLATRIKDLATRARAKKLLPVEVQGATFTITSPGAAGAVIATPVINVPQVGILDMEAIVRRPVVVTDSDGNESIAIRPIAYFVLGWDHRAIDGMYAALFLRALRGRLEGR